MLWTIFISTIVFFMAFCTWSDSESRTMSSSPIFFSCHSWSLYWQRASIFHPCHKQKIHKQSSLSDFFRFIFFLFFLSQTQYYANHKKSRTFKWQFIISNFKIIKQNLRPFWRSQKDLSFGSNLVFLALFV